MRILFFLCAVFGLISCDKKVKIKEKKYPVHIISKYFRENKELRKRYKEGDTSIILQPFLPRYLYGTENFILDDSSNIYYYQLERYFSAVGCGNDMELDSIPFFLNIKPENIIRLSVNSIDDFVKLNIRQGERNLVKIASQKDTLNSKAYFKLQEALDKNLKFREDSDIYTAYPTTQEEDTVLYYKKHKKDYYADSIKRDKKRIRFFPKVKIDE